MKKTLSVLLAVLLIFSISSAAFAADTAAASKKVYVTIADATGKLAAARVEVTVTDADNSGSVTVNDALYCAHAQLYSGGAAAGYASSLSLLGYNITKLWGTTNDAHHFGIYVNGKSVISASSSIADGDSVYAFVYLDNENLSDHYSSFASETATCTQYDETTVTLSSWSYDKNLNWVSAPVVGAAITVDGKATGAVTDANGQAKIVLTSAGDHIVSATSAAGFVITAPVLKVTASQASLMQTLTYYINQLIAMIQQLIGSFGK